LGVSEKKSEKKSQKNPKKIPEHGLCSQCRELVLLPFFGVAGSIPAQGCEGESRNGKGDWDDGGGNGRGSAPDHQVHFAMKKVAQGIWAPVGKPC
jgi:hypothetical protein